MMTLKRNPFVVLAGVLFAFGLTSCAPAQPVGTAPAAPDMRPASDPTRPPLSEDSFKKRPAEIDPTQAEREHKQFELRLAKSGFGPRDPAPGFQNGELHRVWIENRSGGLIRGSKDQGNSWVVLGKITAPITGGVWQPTVENGVLAFNFLRGESNLFATAVNALHIRFSDPEGYELPADPKAPLVIPHGVSLYPSNIEDYTPPATGARLAVTDMHGGTGIFGQEWSPRVGSSKAYMGDGDRFAPIPYSIGPDASFPSRSHLLIVTPKQKRPIEYIEYENKAQGRVLVKYRDSAKLEVVAKVLQPVKGIGRFSGSENIRYPGVLRANHAGVFCFGTTDYNTDPKLPPNVPINDLRGGFQVVPSIHYADSSMNSGGDHGYVYMVVGPVVDPTDMDRYDRGLEGKYPLFFDGVRAGGGQSYYRFGDSSAYYTIPDAIRLKKFRQADGTPVEHLRGVIKDALVRVSHVRYVPCADPKTGCEP